MKRRHVSVCGFVFAIAFLPGLFAQTKGLAERLADQADAVVVGEAVSGQQSGQSFAFTLSVIRALKGAVAPATTLDVSGSARLSSNGSIRGYYGLWFLKKAMGRSWTLIPVSAGSASLQISGFFPLSKVGSPPASAAGASTSDRIAAELAAALESYTDSRQLFNLAYALSEVLDSATPPQEYARLRTNGDPELRFIGLTGLLGTKDDVSALAEIAQNIDMIARLHTSSRVVAAICGHWNPDPAAVRSLGQIASSSNPDLRQCAASALDFIHTRDTLPYLAQLLSSGDARTREYAMQGLSRFVDNLPIPTASNVTNGAALQAKGPTPYRTAETDKYSLSRRWLGREDEAPYLQFWRSWWTQVGNKVP